ncbi:FMN reductase [Sanguibacter suaedae]|uniref:FMN reductase n=1 Tax=Sanguibacter suaedae TaxID=2795737 RepID=A0A934MAU9_9MICO|nr:FMN reductase [Sanguibacter suaedae]
MRVSEDVRRVVVVSAGLGRPSSSRLLADRLVSAVSGAAGARGLSVEVEVVELRDVAHDVMDAMLTGFAGPRLEPVVAAVEGADALVAVTPVFTASSSGLFKSFFDVLDSKALVGVPVLMGATAGSARHSLVLEHAVRPMFAYLRAVVVPTGVFAASEDWGAAGSVGGDLASRVERAGEELAAVLAQRGPRVREVDPFAGLVSFEDQLGAR